MPCCLLWTGWIAAVDGDDRSACCKVCDVVLPAHHAGLTKHSQNSQHLLRLASVNTPTKKTPVQNVSVTGASSNRKSQVDCFLLFFYLTYWNVNPLKGRGVNWLHFAIQV